MTKGSEREPFDYAERSFSCKTLINSKTIDVFENNYYLNLTILARTKTIFFTKSYR